MRQFVFTPAKVVPDRHIDRLVIEQLMAWNKAGELVPHFIVADDDCVDYIGTSYADALASARNYIDYSIECGCVVILVDETGLGAV